MKSITRVKILLVSVSLRRKGGVAQYVLNLLDRFQDKDIISDHFAQTGLLLNLISFMLTLKRGMYDLVHLNPSLGDRALLRDFTYSILANILGYKTLFFIHGWDENTYHTIKNSSLYSKLFVHLIDLQTAVVVLDHGYKDKLVDLGCREDIIHVSSTMVDTSKYGYEKAKNDEEIGLVFCSRMEEEKGIFLLLDALEKLPPDVFDRVKLTYIGMGSCLKELEKAVDHKGLNHKVFVKGYVSEEEKIKTYREGDIFVFPTFHGEGFPTVILEAMAAGLPIITTDVGGTKRAVEKGVNGYYLSSIPPTSEDIAEKIVTTLKSDREKMAFDNIKKVRGLYDSDVVIDKLIEIYKRSSSGLKILLIGPHSPTGGVGGMLDSEYSLLKSIDSRNVEIFNILSLKENPMSLCKLFLNLINADVTHIHCSFATIFSSSQLSIPLLLAKISRTKSLVTYHRGEPAPYFEDHAGFVRFLFSLPDIISVPSKKQKNIFLKYGITEADRIEILYNFIKPYYIQKSREMDRAQKKNCVITTGEVSKSNISRKGFNDFLILAEDIKELEFLLIGKLKDKEALRFKKKCPSNLHVKGFVKEEKLAEYYSKCKVYLQLSRSESFGVSMVEAMCFGCVPIVYDKGALPEVIGGEGYVVDYKDLGSVKNSIKQVMEGKHDKDPRDIVLARYTPSSYLDRLEDIVEELVG